MPFSLTRPAALERVEALLARYDGPIPLRALAPARHGDQFHRLRSRALSREIDRAARDLTLTIAAHRAHLAASPAKAPYNDATMSELSRGLAYYRTLGIRYADAAGSGLRRRPT